MVSLGDFFDHLYIVFDKLFHYIESSSFAE